jgi:hypothetical protein
MALKVRDGGSWVDVTTPKVRVSNNFVDVTNAYARVDNAWVKVWPTSEDVRWSSSAVTTAYGTMTQYDSANTKDGSFGDTSTFGYLYPSDNFSTGSSGVVVYSHATGSASSAVVKVNNKFVTAYSGFMNVSESIEISTNGGSTYGTLLRSRTAYQGSDGSIVTSTSASLGVSNRDQLKIKVSGSYDYYYDGYYELWEYAYGYFEIYDIYVTFS